MKEVVYMGKDLKGKELDVGICQRKATRCIEAGMRPKTLQVILGHSNISITMNLYVHVTEDEKLKEVEMIEEKLKIV